MFFEGKNETPFGERIKNTHDPKVKSLEGTGRFLREIELSGNDADDAALIEKHRKGKDFFAQLATKYGIEMLRPELVVGKNNKGAATLFVVVDEVRGKEVDELGELPQEAKDEADNLYAGLLDHYLAAYQDKAPYWADPGNNQFMYGHTGNANNKHLYLVDVDPEIITYQGESPANNDLLFKRIYGVTMAAIEAERKLPASARLDRTREKLEEVLSVIPREASKREIIERVRKFL